MFHHVKELRFNARVSKPGPRFAGLLLEQFGGPNGELKAAMQYFVQAFAARRPYPDKYDLLMDIATEEFSHLEFVGATITMLLDGTNGKPKNAAEKTDVCKLARGGRKVRSQEVKQVQPRGANQWNSYTHEQPSTEGPRRRGSTRTPRGGA